MRRRKRERYDGLHQRGAVWYCKVRLDKDGKWHELSLGTTSKDEALQLRESKVREFLEERELPDYALMTLDNASEKWLSVRKAEVAPNTHRIDSERMKALCARLGSRTLISLRPEDIRNYQHERRSEVSARTVNLETKVLRLLLTEAHLWTRFEPYFKPLRENRRGPGRALTAEQHEQLFKVVMSDPNAPSPRLASIDRRQLVLRTVDVERLIDEGHSARSIWELVGRLDLSLYPAQIAAVHGRGGRDHTDPQRLISVWLYA